MFITRSAMIKEGKTVYHLDMSIRETGTLIRDGDYRIFANCAVRWGGHCGTDAVFQEHKRGKK